MIRVSHSIATKFNMVVKTLEERLDLETKSSKEILIQVLKKLDEHFGRHAEVINNQARVIEENTQSVESLSQLQGQNTKIFLKVISLYSELATCGIMDSKRKENLKNGNIKEKLQMQEEELKRPQKSLISEIENNTNKECTNVGTDIQPDVQTLGQSNSQPVNQSSVLDAAASLFSIFPSASDTSSNPDEEQFQRRHKKKKKRRRIT